MKGKTLVITGATKGIGKATAIKFAKNGVNVLLLITQMKGLQTLLQKSGKVNLVLKQKLIP